MNYVRRQTGLEVERSEVELEQEKLYTYNHIKYIPMNESYEGYRGQLVEVEARVFGEKVHRKLVDAARMAYNVFENPEIYNPSPDELEQEVRKVLRGMDVEKLLEKMGIRSMDDLEDDETFLGKTEQIMQVLLEFVGVKSATVRMQDGENEGYTVHFDRVAREVKIDRNRIEKQLNSVTLLKLAQMAWHVRQYDEAHGDSERAELYCYNNKYYLRKGERGYDRQLLIAEREKFAGDLLDIMTERLQLNDMLDIDSFMMEDLNEAEKEASMVVEASWKYQVEGVEEKLNQVREHIRKHVVRTA